MLRRAATMLVAVASAMWVAPAPVLAVEPSDWQPVFSESFDDSGALPPGCAAYDGVSDGTSDGVSEGPPAAPRRATSGPRRSPSPAGSCTSPCTGGPTAARRS
ncbi:hypothetical protein [Dactylosporangium cerinum]